MKWLEENNGVGWYAGAPEVGKTFLALEHSRVFMERFDKPRLILDCQEVSTFAEEYHEPDLDRVIETLFELRESCIYTPLDVDDCDRVALAIRKAGVSGAGVVLVVDEAHTYLKVRGAQSVELLRLMRSRRHALAHVLCTTQNLSGDIAPEAFDCSPQVFVFRCTAQPSLEKVERAWGIPPAVASTLEDRTYVVADTKRGAVDYSHARYKEDHEQLRSELPQRPSGNAGDPPPDGARANVSELPLQRDGHGSGDRADGAGTVPG